MYLSYQNYRSLLSKFLGLLEKGYSGNLVSLVLYGSVARGKATK